VRSGADGSVFVGDGLAVVFETGGLCTIFARADDGAVVQAELKKALPPPSTPFKVVEEPIVRNPDMTSTAYHLMLPNGPFADWVFSAFSKPGTYNVAISLQLRKKG
jgi:hypothetical protein